jgi:hypothetical protein
MNANRGERRRIARESGKTSLGEVVAIVGIIFLLLAIGTFSMELASPLVPTGGVNFILIPMGGAIGIILVGLGLWHHKGSRMGGR